MAVESLKLEPMNVEPFNEAGVSFDPSTVLSAPGKMHMCITDLLAHSA